MGEQEDLQEAAFYDHQITKGMLTESEFNSGATEQQRSNLRRIKVIKSR